MKNELNPVAEKTFVSECMVNSEFHAGHLFGIVYRNYLYFDDKNTVTMTRKVIDATRAMDTFDIELLKNFEVSTTYQFSSNNMLNCHFKKEFLNIQITYCILSENMMMAHCQSDSNGEGWGEVYHLLSE